MQPHKEVQMSNLSWSDFDPANYIKLVFMWGLLWWLSAKESACQCRRHGFYPWVRRSPGEGNGNPLQCSCLGNPMNRGAWQATVHGVAKGSDMT